MAGVRAAIGVTLHRHSSEWAALRDAAAERHSANGGLKAAAVSTCTQPLQRNPPTRDMIAVKLGVGAQAAERVGGRPSKEEPVSTCTQVSGRNPQTRDMIAVKLGVGAQAEQLALTAAR